VLSKAVLSPPEKYHGLRDQEVRHRRRYVDLFTNDDVMATFMKRIEIVRYIREFLQERGFLEVETPMMQPIPGGGAALPFVTHHNTLDMDLYLRIAPELYLKRLLVGGMERVFEINRNFRNEGVSPRHNPEFTMLELYQAYGDYNTMMEIIEQMISGLARDVCGSMVLPWGDKEIDFTPPWPRAPFWSLLEEHAGVGRGQDDAIRAKAAEMEVEGAADMHPEWLALQLLDKCVEDKLTGPVFVTDYPKSVCVLTKSKVGDPEIVERFELFIHGMEMANAYTELNDPQEQERRFLHQVGDDEANELIDADFLRALSYGMPPAGGMGVGIDRLAMVLTNNQSIREVILFPLLRPEQ
jgi:lysyl-tRNA synthetase, class II